MRKDVVGNPVGMEKTRDRSGREKELCRFRGFVNVLRNGVTVGWSSKRICKASVSLALLFERIEYEYVSLPHSIE